jgi:hypothetical protein
MSSPRTALVIGGTGAQGSAVVKGMYSYHGKPALIYLIKCTELAATGWAVSILTRNPSNPDAIELASLPNITLIGGNPLDEAVLTKSLPGHHLVFANTNGFAIGEKAEICTFRLPTMYLP